MTKRSNSHSAENELTNEARPRRLFKPGAVIYCWRFQHPKHGWIGGSHSEDWSQNPAIMLSRMEHCEYPKELITETA